MRDLAARVVALLISLTIMCAAAAASFGFFCFAIFSWLSALMPTALAAAATGFAVLVPAALVVMAVHAWLRARAPRRPSGDPFGAGLALGAVFARQFGSFVAENPRASLLASLAAGFLAGASQ